MRILRLSSRICPACGSAETRHSRTRGKDHLWRALLLRPLRCRRCRARFWRFEGRLTRLLRGALLLAAIAVGAAVIWLLLDRISRPPGE